MADKKTTPKIEREYIINLRRSFIKAPKYKRAERSITAIKDFLKQHMKSDNIKLGKYLNKEIWKNGPRNPPSKVHIKAIKEENKVKVELINAPEEKPVEETKKKRIFRKSTEESKEEKEKQVDLSLVDKQKQVAKDKKEKPKEDKE